MTHSMDDVGQENGNNALAVNMEPSSSANSTLQMHSVDIETPEKTEESGWTTMTPQEIAMYIDRRARVFFPCAFLVFNIFYWTFVYYL